MEKISIESRYTRWKEALQEKGMKINVNKTKAFYTRIICCSLFATPQSSQSRCDAPICNTIACSRQYAILRCPIATFVANSWNYPHFAIFTHKSHQMTLYDAFGNVSKPLSLLFSTMLLTLSIKWFWATSFAIANLAFPFLIRKALTNRCQFILECESSIITENCD